MPKRVVISWSGGKDSAWTLHMLRQQPKEYVVIGLLTTINQQFNRIAIHGVRRELLEAQALATGGPIRTCAAAGSARQTAASTVVSVGP